MLVPAAAPQKVVEQIAFIEAELDDVVNHGSDDELFIASYLQGHFAVVARLLEMESSASLSQLNTNMSASLDDAFSQNELEPSDAALVRALWLRLLTSVESNG